MFDNRKAMELQNLYGVENLRKLTIPQMLERGKLIELLRDVQYLGGLEEKIADHLIANGVRIPVPCKDCWKSAEGLCSYQFKNVPGKDFCGDGERKDNGSSNL